MTMNKLDLKYKKKKKKKKKPSREQSTFGTNDRWTPNHAYPPRQDPVISETHVIFMTSEMTKNKLLVMTSGLLDILQVTCHLFHLSFSLVTWYRHVLSVSRLASDMLASSSQIKVKIDSANTGYGGKRRLVRRTQALCILGWRQLNVRKIG